MVKKSLIQRIAFGISMGILGLACSNINAQDYTVKPHPYQDHSVLVVRNQPRDREELMRCRIGVINPDGTFHYQVREINKEGRVVREYCEGLVEEKTFPLKYLEPGTYRAIVEREDSCEFIGGLEKTFRMVPATPGYRFPNDRQTTEFEIEQEGVFDIYAGGNDWRLELGRVKLNRGDKVKFIKDYSQKP